MRLSDIIGVVAIARTMPNAHVNASSSECFKA
jgi:hypothetical protein